MDLGLLMAIARHGAAFVLALGMSWMLGKIIRSEWVTSIFFILVFALSVHYVWETTTL